MRLAGVSCALVIACGGDGNPPSDGAGGDGAACERGCLLGWWIEITGNCSALCTLSPAPAECASADCAQANMYHLDDPAYQLVLAAHSAQDRSFTLFSKTDGAWALPSSCHFTLDASTDPDGSAFSCSATTVDLPARDWNRMPADLELEVDAAAGGTLPAHATY